jgi:hypothetical protein
MYCRFDAHTRTGTPFADAIETVVTSDRLFAENPRTAPLGTSEGVKVLLTAGATTRSVNTTLVVRGRDNFTSKAPRLELAIRVKPRYGVSAVLILLIAIGAVLAGISTKDLGLGDAAWGVKAVGGAIVGAAVFYAQGRTPGVASDTSTPSTTSRSRTALSGVNARVAPAVESMDGLLAKACARPLAPLVSCRECC